MKLETQILMVLLLDLLFGLRQAIPHPRGFIANQLSALERRYGRHLAIRRATGLLTLAALVAATTSVVGIVYWAASLIDPALTDICTIALLFLCISARSIGSCGRAIHRHLHGNDLTAAQNAAARLIGARAGTLDAVDLNRITVESIADKLVRGFTAPLFWALIGGPMAAVTYKTISVFAAVIREYNPASPFAWAFIKMDSILTLIPTRLTAPVIIWATFLGDGRTKAAMQIYLKDGIRQAIPEYQLSRAAFAGALGIQLGDFGAAVSHHPTPLGDPIMQVGPHHILQAASLMIRTAALFAIFGLSIRCAITAWPGPELFNSLATLAAFLKL